ncbi:MAG: cytochrome c maturation protein CcmE [Chloroflexi bacterium]|nr:cytochrome c maturation protein CcmE [Chloroflexota bacterium]
MLRKRKFLIGGGLLMVAVAVLIFNGVRSSAMYWYTPAELKTQGAAAYDKNLRVAGRVDTGSVQQDNPNMTTSFTITYQGESLPIFYKGVMPAGFKEDIDVTIDGKLEPSGVFQASRILTKCPSKYVPEEHQDTTAKGEGS